MENLEQLDAEIELITSSLLPAEHVETSTAGTWPRDIGITSEDSKLGVHVNVGASYPRYGSVKVDVKSKSMGRDEAEGWRSWSEGRMDDWDESEEYPLFQILTTHFLPLLARSSPSEPNSPALSKPQSTSSQPHHALLTSHHLLSPTKRKNLLALSSSLSLVGFSKTGHPGIMYAIGEHDDLVEWIREVKSWQWLALRVRISAEIIEDAGKGGLSRGQEDGARGGKGRGEWVELEKVGEALDWLRLKGRETILTDVGIGASH